MHFQWSHATLRTEYIFGSKLFHIFTEDVTSMIAAVKTIAIMVINDSSENK